MKEKQKYKYNYYSPVKIYFDELDKLINVFEFAKISYSIETSQYSYDNLADFKENNKIVTLRDLRITSLDPYLVIEFTKSNTSLFSDNDDVITLGLVSKIDAILRGCQRVWGFIYSNSVILIMNVLIILWSILGYSGLINDLYIFMSGIVFFLLIIGKIIFIRSKHYSIIYSVTRNERTTFFTRKKDEIILSLINGIIGFVLGVIATYIAMK